MFPESVSSYPLIRSISNKKTVCNFYHIGLLHWQIMWDGSNISCLCLRYLVAKALWLCTNNFLTFNNTLLCCGFREGCLVVFSQANLSLSTMFSVCFTENEVSGYRWLHRSSIFPMSHKVFIREILSGYQSKSYQSAIILGSSVAGFWVCSYQCIFISFFTGLSSWECSMALRNLRFHIYQRSWEITEATSPCKGHLFTFSEIVFAWYSRRIKPSLIAFTYLLVPTMAGNLCKSVLT